jgi:hypothetical protein
VASFLWKMAVSGIRGVGMFSPPSPLQPPLENQRQFIGFGWEARRNEPGRQGTLQHNADYYSRVSQPFSEPEIDHFVMAITAAEAIVRHTTPIRRFVATELIGMGELRCARARHVCLPLPPL